MYNIDEKGFMMGVCQKTHRIFTKRTFEGNGDARAGQDGNREWVTILAAICADETSLSPAVIYKAASGDIQDDWLQDFDPTSTAVSSRVHLMDGHQMNTVWPGWSRYSTKRPKARPVDPGDFSSSTDTARIST